ncbi:MAG TPA: FAD-binding and (Fe-S)-binding domain-containing protein [Vicinamibacterales bacterium]|nr:FAD-binding and (Fe-S)-binding domain-containing protein [Vicinamibacterales bacterium]
MPRHPVASIPIADTPSSPAAADGLADALARRVRGEVRFDAGSRALYATDASNYRQVPIGVVVPRDAEDVLNTLAQCRAHRAPVLGRGGGTSLAGQCCNTAVVLDFSKYMHRVLEIDPGRRRARVQPGAPLDALRDAASRHHLTFGPDPATHQYCTLGGMIGNNSCGIHSVMAAQYGPGPTTADSIESLEIVAYDGTRMRVGATSDAELDAAIRRGGRQGEIYRELRAFVDRHAPLIRREFVDIPRRVSGYNLPALLPEHGFHVARALVGSESTLAIVLEATTTLIPVRPHRILVVLGYPSVYEAADHVEDVLRHRPVGLEGMDDLLLHDLRRIGVSREQVSVLPEGGGWLLAEFGADAAEEAREQAESAVAAIRRHRDAPTCRIIADPQEQARVWELRESGLAATAHVSGENPTWPGWEDSAVPPSRLGRYLRDLRALFDRFEYNADLYGHFGQGCVHCRVDFELTRAEGIATYRRFMEAAADLVVRHGGSLSGDHGDGQARGELLDRMFSPAMLQAFREFKSIWDPDWRMNPGKIIDADPIDSHLRLGATYAPPRPDTWFRFPDDGGDFAHATLRCVGVGKCRKLDTGTMCPSYMVTREEQHATRGRARLLFEMLQGDPLRGGWQNEAVKEALDLCLACKGCKGECPVSVDMATYKAEFLAHYYEQHRRPLTAYTFGWIRRWATLAERAPRLVNLGARTPGLREIAKLAAGMPLARRIPAFAPETFRTRFLARPPRPSAEGPRVILWPDTFNDHFHPDTAMSGVEILEAAGFCVEIPRARLCCGRPLYDYGMLAEARRYLIEIMDRLRREIDAGIPIVVLEPSCAAVFQDELVNLFPEEARARRLRDQVTSLGTFLAQHADRLPPLRLERQALLHGHCHQKALRGLAPELGILDRLGIQATEPDAGCCGMAGSFGFERDHYEVSMAVGERVLLPAVRRAARDTLVMADGFSCREQIAQASDRRALHLADVLRMALREGPAGPSGDCPERAYVGRGDGRLPAGVATSLVAAALAVVVALVWRSEWWRASSPAAPRGAERVLPDSPGGHERR